MCHGDLYFREKLKQPPLLPRKRLSSLGIAGIIVESRESATVVEKVAGFGLFRGEIHAAA
jgi:hypothetical protein